MTAYIDTLLVRPIDTVTYPTFTDLRSVSGVTIIGQIDGLLAPGVLRGSNDVVPGRPGELGAHLPVDKYVIRVPIQLQGATRGQRNDVLRSLGTILTASNGLCTLKRRIATGSGSSYAEATADGQFIGSLAWTLLNPIMGRTELQFYNLSGRWWVAGTGWVLP